jgi:hypothetical protein
MKDEEGNTLKSYDNHEGCMALPRNSVECGKNRSENESATPLESPHTIPDEPIPAPPNQTIDEELLKIAAENARKFSSENANGLIPLDFIKLGIEERRNKKPD